MTGHRVFTVDAFTKRAYGGNPCAVVFDADDLSTEQMQIIAQEMNLSETAFVLSSDRAAFRVRYFTPRAEIPFAGHPTIQRFMPWLRKGISQCVRLKGISISNLRLECFP